ncbi:prevent-host-death protein [Methylobacterium brachiatum]|jgi:antitoxin (DNA-binding transcriptional repressor) of toxin-antitoxin stability system|uniref:prevent-host-death protein n=1 Tax=Methylobacterium brachiatum TaxID=269660 RepID=UPI0008F28AE0|nr:prevent-host-death protein [Methylobacterium brachiatum]SFI17778.1 Antitoxin component of toxin-antitoxin stability system, DNA-binding transcriptional repressor [Methylobacterium brachiatum]
MAGPVRNKTTPRRIGVRTFRNHIDAFLREARNGHTFLVTSRGEVLAELRPPADAVRADRTPGALRGRIRMAPDFDTLPPDMLAAMQGEEP